MLKTLTKISLLLRSFLNSLIQCNNSANCVLHFRCMKQKYHFCLSFLYSWTSLCIFCWNIFVNTWWWCIYWSKWKLISFRSNFCVLHFPYTASVKFFLYVSKCWYWEVRSVSPESISFGDMFHVINFQVQSQLKHHL